MLAAAEDALARLDERIRASPIAAGFVSRSHFQDACASLWLAGELVSLEDLVLHDARMDVHAPTHALTRAQMVLRARRRIAGVVPDWALSPDGLKTLRGDGDGGAGEAVGAGEGDGPEDDEAPGSPGDGGLLAGELTAINRVLSRSTKSLWPARPRRRFSAILSSMIRTRKRTQDSRRGGAPPRKHSPIRPSWRRPSCGTPGQRPATRTAGLARPAAGFGDAAGAAKNAGASGVCEFCLALRPARKTPLAGPGRKACRLFGSNCGGGGGRDEGP